MAEGRDRLDWTRTSMGVACILNSFRGKGSSPLAGDFLVPDALRLTPREKPEPPALLPVDVLIDIFCKKPG